MATDSRKEGLMGYIYEEVKKQMNGLNRKPGGGLIQNWSPNLYRCIIISPSFIFIAKHIGNPIVQQLDPQKVMEDLESYSRGQGKGALHNLFSERQLSCLEEIYFDEVFKSYQNLFDINMYISKVKNSASRLRYYGYCRTNGDLRIASWLVGMYQRADVLYCLAKDKNRVFPLEYKEVGELNWYKNYNLRPMYYKLDSDKGQLAIYFRKNEKNIEELLKKYDDSSEDARNSTENSKSDRLRLEIEKDIENLEYTKKFNKLAVYVMSNRSKDSLAKVCYSCMLQVIKENRIVDGLTESYLRKLLASSYDESTINSLIGAYNSFMVIDKRKKEETVELKASTGKAVGLLNIGSLYDKVCLLLADEITKDKVQSLLITVNASIHASELPMGKFKEKYVPRDLNEGTLDGYISYLSDVVGVDINTL